MPCDACTAALASATSGSVNPNCDQCRVRELAKAPKGVRDRAYADEQAARGSSARAALGHKVSEEYRRLRALKGN